MLAQASEAWGFGGIVAGGILALVGRLVLGHWRHSETADDLVLADSRAATKAMEVVFAEGRSLVEYLKAERDALRVENAELRARIRTLEESR